jgi:hypothetical protein
MVRFRRCPSPRMEAYFNVGDLSAERLLAEWRWLCPTPVSLVARTAFGDLFLRTESGTVVKLDVSAGQLTVVAETVGQFLSMAALPEKRSKFFAEDDERAVAQRGLVPTASECIAFKIPLCFRESATAPNNVYVANLYEYISFLGEIHRQIADQQDGKKIRLRVTD